MKNASSTQIYSARIGRQGVELGGKCQQKVFISPYLPGPCYFLPTFLAACCPNTLNSHMDKQARTHAHAIHGEK